MEGSLEAPGGAGNRQPLRPPSLPASAGIPGSLHTDPPARGAQSWTERDRARRPAEQGMTHGWAPRARRGWGAGLAPARRRRPCPAPTRGTPVEPGAQRFGDVQNGVSPPGAPRLGGGGTTLGMKKRTPETQGDFGGDDRCLSPVYEPAWPLTLPSSLAAKRMAACRVKGFARRAATFPAARSWVADPRGKNRRLLLARRR